MADQEPEKKDQMADTDSHEGPLSMQFFSTWEVRKVPANCVPRLCTLNIDRLEIVQPIEPGLQSVVLSVSMKTPHRSLRSNELPVPANGILAIPLKLLFSLQYPHFLKRGGNDLQISLQRRKRYRNRPIRGYKTLAMGEINMSLVLQKSFQGVVKLYSEKSPESLASVRVASLTSTVAEVESRAHVVEVSSEDEEDELIFSDELHERGSDTDSDPEDNRPLPKISLKHPSSVLRLLRLRRLLKGRNVPVEVTMELEEGDRESAISSLTDSFEEEEEQDDQTQESTRPRLNPFYGPDSASMLSLPHGHRTLSEALSNPLQYTPDVDTHVKRPSLSSPYSTDGADQSSTTGPPLELPDAAIVKGRLWLVQDGSPHVEGVKQCLTRQDEPILTISKTAPILLSLLSAIQELWVSSDKFQVILVGGDLLFAAALKGYMLSPELAVWFTYIPTDGVVSGRLLAGVPIVLAEDEGFSDDSYTSLLHTLLNPVNERLLPVAQAELRAVVSSESSHLEQDSAQHIPFVSNVVLGHWETESDVPAGTPASPPGPGEQPEIMLEYWTGKKDSQKSTVKVRGVMVTLIEGPTLNVTATMRDKSKKGIRIRKAKELEGTILSLTATQLACKPCGKHLLTAFVDGLEWNGLSSLRLTSQWDQSPTSGVPLSLIKSFPS